jgi:hypothetical protein
MPWGCSSSPEPWDPPASWGKGTSRCWHRPKRWGHGRKVPTGDADATWHVVCELLPLVPSLKPWFWNENEKVKFLKCRINNNLSWSDNCIFKITFGFIMASFLVQCFFWMTPFFVPWTPQDQKLLITTYISRSQKLGTKKIQIIWNTTEQTKTKTKLVKANTV